MTQKDQTSENRIVRLCVDLPMNEVSSRNMVGRIPHWSLFELCTLMLSNGVVGADERMPCEREVQPRMVPSSSLLISAISRDLG